MICDGCTTSTPASFRVAINRANVPMNYVERADYFFFAISRRIGSPPSGPSDITNTE